MGLGDTIGLSAAESVSCASNCALDWDKLAHGAVIMPRQEFLAAFREQRRHSHHEALAAVCGGGRVSAATLLAAREDGTRAPATPEPAAVAAQDIS